jgi:two-component system, NarL family, invasion response regulator UvrY
VVNWFDRAFSPDEEPGLFYSGRRAQTALIVLWPPQNGADHFLDSRTIRQGPLHQRLARVVECRNVASALVIDDHPVARHGCRRVLERIGITTVFEAGDVVTGYELFGRHRPDIVVVDLGLGDNRLDGLSLIRRFNSENPKAHILVLSMHRDPNVVSRALEAGAAGYILKDAAVEDLLKAFQAVQVGNPYLSDELASQVAMARTPLRQNPLAQLTPGEL